MKYCDVYSKWSNKVPPDVATSNEQRMHLAFFFLCWNSSSILIFWTPLLVTNCCEVKRDQKYAKNPGFISSCVSKVVYRYSKLTIIGKNRYVSRSRVNPTIFRANLHRDLDISVQPYYFSSQFTFVVCRKISIYEDLVWRTMCLKFVVVLALLFYVKDVLFKSGHLHSEPV